MWIDVDTIREAMSRAVTGVRTPDHSAYEHANEIRKAEKAILEKGVAVCLYCDEEIRYNSVMAVAGLPWESKYLVGWCDNNKGSKHTPRIETKNDV